MTDHAKHTEGPLVMGKMGVIKGGPFHEFTKGSGQSQLFMAMAGLEMGHKERDANAAHLVKCWNLHYELVGVLRALRNEAVQDEEFTNLSAAEFKALLTRADEVLEQADAA